MIKQLANRMIRIRFIANAQKGVSRFPDALDLVFVAFVIVGLLVSFFAAGRFAIVQAETSEGIGLASAIEQELLIYKAEHGAWPKPGHKLLVILSPLPTLGLRGRFLKSVNVGENGAFTLVYAPSTMLFSTGHKLTYRPVHIDEPAQNYTFWICGFAHAPNGASVIGSNFTDFNEHELPPSCRG